MTYETRKSIYQKIETLRSQPLITYMTSIRPNASGQIASDVIREFIRQITQIPKENKDVDILIVSNGGDGSTASRIINLLRERFENITVLIPYVAYSAATLLAIGANEIIMHPFSNLGPVDPQLVVRKNGQEFNYGVEDLRNYLAFVRQEVGVSDQQHLLKAFEILTGEAGAIPIGIARRGSELIASLGEKMLALSMNDSAKVKTIVETLSRSYHDHSYSLNIKEAEKVGLPVTRASEELANLMWQVWEDAEAEMECNTQFNAMEYVLSRPECAEVLLAPVTQINGIPQNLPDEMKQDVYNTVLSQLNIVTQTVPAVDYSLLIALVESKGCCSQNKLNGKLIASKLSNGSIYLTAVETKQGWTTI